MRWPVWRPVRLATAALLAGAAACGEPGEAASAEAAALAAPPAGGGAVHLVRLVARGDAYAFAPRELRIRAGDVVRFVQTGSQPESVVFEPEGAPAGGATWLREHGVVHGPLLIGEGEMYDVYFGGAPPGRYPFRSAAHPAPEAAGAVIVLGAAEQQP